jgi:hypothetical protein
LRREQHRSRDDLKVLVGATPWATAAHELAPFLPGVAIRANVRPADRSSFVPYENKNED